MAISVRDQEIRRLIRFYRKSIRDMANEFVAAADFESATLQVHLQQAFAILDQLDERTARWANRNIGRLYRSAVREARGQLRNLDIDPDQIIGAQEFAVIHRRAIESLLVDPEVGFISNLRQATTQIRDRMRSIRRQATLLRDQQKFFDETIARTGFLEGRNLNEVRDRLVREMSSLKESSDLLFTRRARNLSPGQIIRDVADLPYIKIPTVGAAVGFRRLRIDQYAEMLARTKTGQAANLARRNTALENGVQIVQISKNKPLHDDACFLYIGKSFALTESAKEEFGIPHVRELPNGGAPFHPNCTHQELHFVIDFESKKERDLSFVPPPDWALNRSWAEVQKEYNNRGGSANAASFNKQVQVSFDTGGRQRRRRR